MNKNKKFNLFDWYFKGANKDNDKLDINVLEKPNLSSFFKVLRKKFNKLLSANLLFVFGNFPIFFFLLALSGILSDNTTAPLYQVWGPINGIGKFDSDSTKILSTIFGTHTETTIINTPTIVFFCLGALVIFTLGFTKIGTTYIYRNILNGEPVFPMSDFFYVIKRNIKQALVLGIIDSLFIGMFIYNISYLYKAYELSSMNSLMFFFTLAMCIIYSFVRPYAYLIAFTFDMKLRKIIKNAVFFILLGLKRNLMALLGIIVVIIINYCIFLLLMPLGLILPFIITFAVCDFIQVYAAYPVILKYMVSDEDRNRIIYRTNSVEDNDEASDEIEEETEG